MIKPIKGKGKKTLEEKVFKKIQQGRVYYDRDARKLAKELAKIAYEKALECVGEDLPIPADPILKIRANFVNKTKEYIRKRIKEAFLGED